MTTQKDIRQAFTRDWNPPAPPGQTAWLIKGDFDQFRRVNDLYGALIADTLLDWTLEVIEARFKAEQNRWGCGEILCSAIGDDLTIYIPTAALPEEEIARALWQIRAAIADSYWLRYRVGALPLPVGYFDGVAPERLARLRQELEAADVVLDFAPRQRGCLALLPLNADGRCRPSLAQLTSLIERRCGAALPPIDLRLDWLFDPDRQTYLAFNQGYLHPPGVSFAACPAQSGARDAQTAYERLSLACQAALKTCKQQRSGVRVAIDADAPTDPSPAPAAPLALDPERRLHCLSGRYLRETLYFRRPGPAAIYQLNPVYALQHTPLDLSQVEQYRGSPYGVGLKGINAILGHSAADRLLRRLAADFNAVLQTLLDQQGLSMERVWTARFVDRFTVFCEPPLLEPSALLVLMKRLARQFNAAGDEFRIAQLRLSHVQVSAPAPGYRLWQQLDFTSLAPQPSAQIKAHPPIEVRHNTPGTLRAGQMALERAALESAKYFNSAFV